MNPSLDMTPSVSVAAGLIWRQDGCLLVSQRPAGGAHAGEWELPGGKIEPGETPPQALVREIEEELGILVEAGPEFGRVVHDYPTLRVTLIGMHARYTTGEPLKLGVADFRWIHPGELPGLQFPEANARLFGFPWQTPPDKWGILPT
ncbi:MAG: (deoxy)nucleoside triphosphate pyrophosphohydrolase [bacterium]